MTRSGPPETGRKNKTPRPPTSFRSRAGFRSASSPCIRSRALEFLGKVRDAFASQVREKLTLEQVLDRLETIQSDFKALGGVARGEALTSRGRNHSALLDRWQGVAIAPANVVVFNGRGTTNRWMIVNRRLLDPNRVLALGPTKQ
jgi:hypothetical protein